MSTCQRPRGLTQRPSNLACKGVLDSKTDRDNEGIRVQEQYGDKMYTECTINVLGEERVKGLGPRVYRSRSWQTSEVQMVHVDHGQPLPLPFAKSSNSRGGSNKSDGVEHKLNSRNLPDVGA